MNENSKFSGTYNAGENEANHLLNQSGKGSLKQ